MADNTTLNLGAGGDTISTDDLGSVKVQRVKVQYGTDGSATDVSTSNPLPVDLSAASLAALESITVVDGGGSLTVDGTVELGSTSLAALESLTTITTVSTVTAVTAITNALPAGTNNIGDVDVLSIVPGTGATNLGKAEDAPHASGDTGVMSLAVRRDADTALVSADGDYAPLQVNAAGSLKVAITSGAGSGGTSIADGASFTRDTTSITPAGAAVESSAPTLTTGDVAALSMTTGGALRVAMTSGGVAGIAEDTASVGSEEGVAILAVRRDVASSGVSADGDFAFLSVDSSGNLRTTGASGITSYTEDAASAGGESMVLMGAVRQDTPASSTSADGDYSNLKVNNVGRLYVEAALAATQTLSTVTTVSTVTNVATIGTSVTPGTGAAHLGKSEDGAHASSDTGVFVLAVRQDTLASSTNADGDYAAFKVDSSGRLYTTDIMQGQAAQDAAIAGNPVQTGLRASTATPTAMSADGDNVYAWSDRNGAIVVTGRLLDDSAFTPGTDRVVPVGFLADETSTDSVDENDIGAPRMTLDRKVVVTDYAHAAGGATPGRILSAASTNGTVIKASAGTLYSLIVTNTNAAARYLKVYNSTTVTVGTTTPTWTIAIPGATTGAGFAVPIPACGINFGTGLCMGLTTGAADNDTGAVGANDICVNYSYI